MATFFTFQRVSKSSAFCFSNQQACFTNFPCLWEDKCWISGFDDTQSRVLKSGWFNKLIEFCTSYPVCIIKQQEAKWLFKFLFRITFFPFLGPKGSILLEKKSL